MLLAGWEGNLHAIKTSLVITLLSHEIVNFSFILEEKSQSFFSLRKHVNVCSNNTFCIRTPFTVQGQLSPSTLSLRFNQKSLPKCLLIFGGQYIQQY